MANLNLGRDMVNKRERIVAKSYPLYLAVTVLLLKINPSA